MGSSSSAKVSDSSATRASPVMPGRTPNVARSRASRAASVFLVERAQGAVAIGQGLLQDAVEARR